MFQSTGQVLVVFALGALSPLTRVDKPRGVMPKLVNASLEQRKALPEAVAESRIPRKPNGKQSPGCLLERRINHRGKYQGKCWLLSIS